MLPLLEASIILVNGPLLPVPQLLLVRNVLHSDLVISVEALIVSHVRLGFLAHLPDLLLFLHDFSSDLLGLILNIASFLLLVCVFLSQNFQFPLEADDHILLA